MSYDVYVGVETYSYTFNLSTFFHTYLTTGGKTGIQCLDGLKGKTAARVISVAIELAEADLVRTTPQNYQDTFDAPNGWGSTIGAILWLSKLMAACYEKPRYVIRVGV